MRFLKLTSTDNKGIRITDFIPETSIDSIRIWNKKALVITTLGTKYTPGGVSWVDDILNSSLESMTVEE